MRSGNPCRSDPPNLPNLPGEPNQLTLNGLLRDLAQIPRRAWPRAPGNAWRPRHAQRRNPAP
eukprot:8274707-Lingulodinium_polyedra.AAC.1